MDKQNLLKSINWISAVVAAISASVAVFLTYCIHQDNQQAQKPHFVISETEIYRDKNDLKYVMNLNIENAGVHPATFVRGHVKLLDWPIINSPYHFSSFT